MKAAATRFAELADDWQADRLGLYFHAYGHASVNSLHLHMVDESSTGPTFDALLHKNLKLDHVVEVLEAELEKL